MRNLLRSRVTAVGLGAVLIAVLAGVGSASAHGPNHEWADSHRIKDDSIRSRDVRNGGLGLRDFNQFTKDQINEPGEPGADGQDGADGVSGLEQDGFYDQLVVGDEIQKFYAECADGKYAVGGGFSPEDGFPYENLQVIASRPSTRDGDFTVIDGDPEGSVRTTAWEVWAINTGDAPVNIRPWSSCVNIAD